MVVMLNILDTVSRTMSRTHAIEYVTYTENDLFNNARGAINRWLKQHFGAPVESTDEFNNAANVSSRDHCRLCPPLVDTCRQHSFVCSVIWSKKEQR